jgi:tRNA dimethylallyltransferase
MKPYNLITILGPTASGKTSLAAHLAYRINGEIISADSRQVYRGMNLGTGKDFTDYKVNGFNIPYHLIDIADAGYEYNVFEYQHDFISAFNDIRLRNRFPVLCGGSGLYIEAVLKGYKLINVPVNEMLRKQLMGKNIEELTSILSTYKTLHNITDIDTVKRAIRAIEIEEYYLKNRENNVTYPEINCLIIGVKFDRETRRKRITDRLEARLKIGMVEEVDQLIQSGIKPESLIYYGLEYKFLTQYVIGEIGYNEMFTKLETAIHQFAKRQMTWFRHMEKNGFIIRWLDGNMPMEEKLDKIVEWMKPI